MSVTKSKKAEWWEYVWLAGVITICVLLVYCVYQTIIGVCIL